MMSAFPPSAAESKITSIEREQEDEEEEVEE